MAADGTYYWPAAGYFRPDEGGRVWNTFLHIELTGGSGTATATLEGSQDQGFSSPVDITDLFGVTQWQATTGATETVTAGDDSPVPKFGAWRYVRVKIVLSTGGADDADYSVEMIRR